MSQDDQLSHYVPRRLDDRPKLLFWEWDVAFIALVGILGGVYSGYTWFGIAAGVAMAGMWSRLKSGKHPGMATHVLYWFVGQPKLKEFPASHLRELIG